MNSFDFSFFDHALRNVRRLKGYPYDVIRGAEEIGSGSQLKTCPRMIEEPNDFGDGVFETTSYATIPGHGVTKLQQMVGNPLPPDLVAFYESYEKALVVTRTYPLHLWHEAKIIEEIAERREFLDSPIRTFRFGEQYDRQATQYGLWLEEPGTMKWRVIGMENGIIDEMDDPYVEPDRIIGQSFYEWIKSWVERDGLPDPFMQLGPEGGFLEPV